MCLVMRFFGFAKILNFRQQKALESLESKGFNGHETRGIRKPVTALYDVVIMRLCGFGDHFR